MATHYAHILKDLGLLSKGEVILKTASDFIGQAIGTSETITRGILEQAKGCVLVIDEAYGLYAGASIGKQSDPYREGVINTLVEQIQGSPGEDRAVVMLGYREDMETMIKNSNPGLARRFNLENAFDFADYSDASLLQVLMAEAKKKQVAIDLPVAAFAIEQLGRARAAPNFGNVGSLKNLFTEALRRMNSRVMKQPRSASGLRELIADDFINPAQVAPDRDPFEGIVGCASVKKLFDEFRATVAHCNSKGTDPKELLSFTFLFLGAPGTGKTTVARGLGKLFQSFKLIPTADVEEVSAGDLVTGYLGQTALKTKEIFEKARGKVLFIDEAYRLNPRHGGQYMKEAVDEIVKLLTDPKFERKMIVILAGYEKDWTNAPHPVQY